MGILKTYSSYDRKLTANDVFEKLGGEIDVKTVRATLKNLFELLGPDSESEIKKNNYFNCVVHCYRIIPRGKAGQGGFGELKNAFNIPSKVELYYWLENKLTDAMIDLLKASVVSNQYLSSEKTAKLVKALDDTKNARDKITKEESYRPILETMQGRADIGNDITIENINKLMNIIREGKKVKFDYCIYNSKVELVGNGKGTRLYNPYAVLSINGYYYLIVSSAEGIHAVNAPEDRDYVTYRIDRMNNIEKVNSPREKRPSKLNPYFNKGAFDAIKYRNEHPAMMGGDAVRVRLLCKKKRFNNIIDTFGFDVQVYDTEIIEGEEYYYINLKGSREGLKIICKTYCNECHMIECIDDVELPEIINNEIKEAVAINARVINAPVKQK